MIQLQVFIEVTKTTGVQINLNMNHVAFIEDHDNFTNVYLIDGTPPVQLRENRTEIGSLYYKQFVKIMQQLGSND